MIDKYKLESLKLTFTFLILLVTISPYIYLAFFSVPSADDFTHSALSIKEGIIGFIIHRYQNWSGRYSSDFLISTFNVLGQEADEYFLINHYYLVPLFIIFLFVISNYLLAYWVLRIRNNKIQLFFALVAAISILSNIELRSTVFWLAGGAAYGVAMALYAVAVALTIYTVYDQNKNSLLILSNIFLILFINGLSETVMVSFTVFLMSLFFLDFVSSPWIQLKRLWIKLLYIGAACSSALLVYLAPGNVVRASSENFPSSGKFILAILGSLKSILLQIYGWVDLLWACFFILVVLIIDRYSSRSPDSFIINKKRLVMIIIALAISLFMSYFVRWYAMGFEGPLRANSISYIVFFLLTIFLAYYFTIDPRFRNLLAAISETKLLIIVLAYCSFSLVTNFEILTDDFRALKTHNEYYLNNYSKIIKANPKKHIELPPEPSVSILRWKCYLTADREYWTNVAFAEYFHLKSVATLPGRKPDIDCGGI